MTTEEFNKLKPEDFPINVKYTGLLYEQKEFIAESKRDIVCFGYHYIEVVQKNSRLKIFGKQMIAR